jgi:hypothetical protein
VAGKLAFYGTFVGVRGRAALQDIPVGGGGRGGVAFQDTSLKVHKHEILWNFFLPKSNPYMPFVNFRKKIRLFSFDFRQNFDLRTFPL